MEFLVDMETTVPAGTSQTEVDKVRAAESAHSAQLADQGHLLRLWRPPLEPGQWRTWGLFQADDPEQLERVLAGMPLRIWRHDTVTPLSPHPNDPGLHSG
jgi:muconolactone delta-isomerase